MSDSHKACVVLAAGLLVIFAVEVLYHYAALCGFLVHPNP